ncbi:winged helix-turn-helix transcriptional regulator [Candidatus Sumerlaeota bacterium]|nr:winged helix-turn-helix transcriptional regulator [Candidatus Sumerlaeota bacterium]
MTAFNDSATAILESPEAAEMAEPAGPPAKIDEVRESMGPMEMFSDVASLFHVLSDASRLRLITALAKTPLCVGELSEIVGLGQSATSHALRVLRDCRVVRAEREGQQVRYELSNGAIRSLLSAGWIHALDQKPPQALREKPTFTGEIDLKSGKGKDKKKGKKKKKKG